MKKFLAVPVAVFVLTACTVLTPFEKAQTLEQRYFALSKTYNILLEDVRDVVVDQALPLDIRKRARDAVLRVNPVMEEMDKAFATYIIEKAKYDAGRSDEEKINIAAANLDLWVTQVQTAIESLAAALAGERS